MVDKGTFDASGISLLNQRTDIEPVYVNEKQYSRILKRRVARMKLEQEGRIPKERRVSYIYHFLYELPKNWYSPLIQTCQKGLNSCFQLLNN